MAQELQPGTRLAGYRVEAFIARGGMGEVYRATQVGLDRTVALKLIAPELAEDPDFRERFAERDNRARLLSRGAPVRPSLDFVPTERRGPGPSQGWTR